MQDSKNLWSVSISSLPSFCPVEETRYNERNMITNTGINHSIFPDLPRDIYENPKMVINNIAIAMEE